ncbi:cupin domain-containing protein [Pseudokordiimonas caeni]|uniref:cupin domain-containing protein n=1 Tax=Pseudokordiimonas caeni TaxID=2997908 RepID=UPI002810F65B|nr:cupin domain-containing protein [Pseudokordiimonas caeni]
MTNPILNIEDIAFSDFGHGHEEPGMGKANEKYAARLGSVSTMIGARDLGYNVCIIKPKSAAFPFHAHAAIEEMFFILEGVGELRLGDKRYPVRKGDFIACPTGDKETAHQISNTSETDNLTMIAVSTMRYPEVCQYPDSGKVLTIARFETPEGERKVLRRMVMEDTNVGYWEGE